MIAGTRYILTADPDLIKAVLATSFDKFGKGKVFNRQFRDFLGDSVFTTDGQEWHDSRQMIRPVFVNQRLGDLEVFEKHIQKLISVISEGEQPAPIQELFFRYTLDVSTEFMYGESVGSLSNPQTEFANSIAEVQKIQAVLARSGCVQNKTADLTKLISHEARCFLLFLGGLIARE
jgi:cytochrome P450